MTDQQFEALQRAFPEGVLVVFLGSTGELEIQEINRKRFRFLRFFSNVVHDAYNIWKRGKGGTQKPRDKSDFYKTLPQDISARLTKGK